MALGILTGLAGALLWAVTAGGTQPYETYEEAVATDGPVAQFRFNDAPGSKTIEDFVGLYTATNNGIVLGGEGPFGGSKSGSFGGEAYASLPSSPLASAGAFTMEGWIDWTGGSSYEQPVFDFGSSTTNYMFLSPASSLSSHKMLFEIRTGTSSNVQVTAPKLAAKKWEYVAVTETGSGTLTLYLNGEQVGQTTGATLFPSSLGSVADDYLGKSQISSAPLFNGSLSNIAFYNKALPAERLKAHYDAGEYPVDTEAPTISGTTRDGSTLTAKTGGWTGLSPISYTYQWMLCNAAGEGCTSILSATEAKYTLGHEDVGQTVRVAVTATNSAGNSTATSTQTAVIAPLGPSNTVLPAISGAAEQGQLLSVSNGTWTGTPPLSYSYKWDTCNSAGEKCKTITGATSSSYRVLGSQIGDTLRAVVTAENAAGSKSADSEPTSVVTTGPPVNTELPTVSGEAKEDKTLSTSTGTWAGTEPFTYTYQWQHCTSTETSSCTDVSGATSQTYTIQESDAGDWIRACVTAHNGYGETTACSVGVGPVGEGSGELKPNLTATGCFEPPKLKIERETIEQGEGTKRMTECDYPTPENAGAEAPVEDGGTGKKCTELPTYTSKPEAVFITANNVTIEDKLFTGYVQVSGEHDKLKDDCQIFQEREDYGADGTGMEVSEANYFTLENSTIKTKNLTTWTYTRCITSEDHGNTGTLLKRDVIEGCNGSGGMIHGSAVPGHTFEILETYVFDNGNIGKEERELSIHREDGFQTEGHITIKRSTILNPTNQVALYFPETESHAGKNQNGSVLEENLFSGGATEFGTGEDSEKEAINSNFIYRKNRVARCLTTPFTGVGECAGSLYEGGDSHGYMEYGGSTLPFSLYSGATLPFFESGNWEGNFWDDNHATISEAEGT